MRSAAEPAGERTTEPGRVRLGNQPPVRRTPGDVDPGSAGRLGRPRDRRNAYRLGLTAGGPVPALPVGDLSMHGTAVLPEPSRRRLLDELATARKRTDHGPATHGRHRSPRVATAWPRPRCPDKWPSAMTAGVAAANLMASFMFAVPANLMANFRSAVVATGAAKSWPQLGGRTVSNGIADMTTLCGCGPADCGASRAHKRSSKPCSTHVAHAPGSDRGALTRKDGSAQAKLPGLSVRATICAGARVAKPFAASIKDDRDRPSPSGHR